MIEVTTGSNVTAGHYVVEHKLWVFLWRSFIRNGEVFDHNFIINTKLFWYENNGTFRRFRWKKI